MFLARFKQKYSLIFAPVNPRIGHIFGHLGLDWEAHPTF
jgi:hypothetical protein